MANSQLAVKLAPEPDWSPVRPVKLPDGSLSYIKDHVKIGVRAIIENPYLFNTDEMGGMKTAQSIIGAQYLYLAGKIKKVIVVAPAAVFRDVWFDDELGELRKHLWVPSMIELYHAKRRYWAYETGEERLEWIITNYEFIRREERLEPLLEEATSDTLLILDESSAVKSHSAATTKACMKLRWRSFNQAIPRCGRIIELNGTPIANNYSDLFSQGNLLHPSILECSGITKFRARYCEMGGYVVRTPWGARPTQVVGWKHVEDIQRRFAPYVLRRLKRDCLDLPPVLPEVTINPTLDKETWKVYKEMKDEMVAWLQNNNVSVAGQTIIKILRLSQITSGFIGGLEPEVYDIEEIQNGRPDFLLPFAPDSVPVVSGDRGPVQFIGREKLDAFFEFLEERLADDPNIKLIVWCRFIPELRRLLDELATKYPKIQLGAVAGKSLLGGTKKDERMAALRLLNPATAPEGPVVVAGTYGTGSLGLNFTASHTVVNLSYDYSYWKFEQSAARVDRPGQVHPVSTFDFVAVGPNGQRTVDHSIVRARREKADAAELMTAAWWIKALQEE